MRKNKLYLNSKKGQSAMEYLMTYGWSILIIAIVLVSLFELGIFGSNSLSGNGACISQSGYLCTKVTLATNGILSATIGSAYGAITLTGIACTNNSAQPTSFNTITSTQINNGETIPMSFLCPLTNNALGSSFNGNLWIEYTSGTVSDQITKVGAVSLKATIPGTSGSSSGSGTQQIYYAPITLSNGQSNSVPADFQQMIYFNPTSYSSNEMANLSNIEFTASAPIGTSGNVPLYSWIESNAFSTSTNTVIWVNLGSNTMGAAGSGSNTLTIYMNFLNSNTPVTSGYTGYAPELWCASGCFQTSYAQYDNGVNVFNFYDNFAGTILSSKWSVISNLLSGDTATVNNGLSLSFTGGNTGNYIIYSTTSFPQNSIVENLFSTNIFATNLRTANPSFSSSNLEPDLVDFINYGASSLSINKAGVAAWTNIVSYSTDFSTGNGQAANNWITGIGYANNFYLYGFSTVSPNNYQPYVETSSEPLGSATGNLYVQLGVSVQGTNIEESWTWVRVRAYPPNGVMPDVNLGTLS